MKCPYCEKEIDIKLVKLETPKKELDSKSKNTKAVGIFCSICAKEIVPVDVEIKGQPRHFDPEQIAWFSQKEFSKNICWSCQNEPTFKEPIGEGN